MTYRLEYTEQPTTIVYLSLKGDDLLPDNITHVLGVQPDKAWKKGDVMKPRRRVAENVPLPTYSFGHWALNAPCSQYDESEYQIDKLLTFLERLPADLNHYVEIFDGSIIIGFSSGEVNIGFYLSSSIILRAAKFGLAIVFDIYPISRADDTESLSDTPTIV